MTEFDRLIEHVGHDIECVTYGIDQNVSVECVDCSVVLLSSDKEDCLQSDVVTE